MNHKSCFQSQDFYGLLSEYLKAYLENKIRHLCLNNKSLQKSNNLEIVSKLVVQTVQKVL